MHSAMITGIIAGMAAFSVCILPLPSKPAIDSAAVEQAFYAAEATAALFSGYAGNVYAEGTIDVDGVRYDRFEICADMNALEALVRASFDDALSAEFLAAEAYDGHPLYIEQDGTLYRFGGYAAQFDYYDSMAAVTDVRAKNGVIYVDVASTFDIMDDPLTVTHTYTCIEENGEYRFTGEFRLPFEVVYSAWLTRWDT